MDCGAAMTLSIDSTASTRRNWEEKWIEVRGIGPYTFTVPYDIEKEAFYRKNLIANRGRFPVRTDNDSL